MVQHKVTFIIQTDDYADPSSILDAAHQCAEDLVSHLESVNITATVDEDETCVEEHRWGVPPKT